MTKKLLLLLLFNISPITTILAMMPQQQREASPVHDINGFKPVVFEDLVPTKQKTKKQNWRIFIFLEGWGQVLDVARNYLFGDSKKINTFFGDTKNSEKTIFEKITGIFNDIFTLVILVPASGLFTLSATIVGSFLEVAKKGKEVFLQIMDKVEDNEPKAIDFVSILFGILGGIALLVSNYTPTIIAISVLIPFASFFYSHYLIYPLLFKIGVPFWFTPFGKLGYIVSALNLALRYFHLPILNIPSFLLFGIPLRTPIALLIVYLTLEVGRFVYNYSGKKHRVNARKNAEVKGHLTPQEIEVIYPKFIPAPNLIGFFCNKTIHIVVKIKKIIF